MENESPVSALTIDLEDYFQVSGFEDVVPRETWGGFESRAERSTEKLLRILAEFRTSATFFVLGWTAQRHPSLVRRIRQSGHEVGCHSFAHRLVYRCTPEEFREDTRHAKAVIEDILGEAILCYRAPSFSITRKSLWAMEILAEEGFRYDSSMFPILRDRYGIPNIPRHTFRIALSTETSAIAEVPPSTVRWLGICVPMGGGGYLRLFLDWLFRRAIRQVIEGERKPAILYLHPWELDPDQPRILNGSGLSQFRHTINLAKTERKLTALLSRWRFAPLTEVVDRMEHLPLLLLQQIARQSVP